MAVMVAVCEIYQVTPDDIVFSHSKHPSVVAARNILVYLGWERCKIGTGILASILNKSQTDTSAKLSRLKKEIIAQGSFHRQVGVALRHVRRLELDIQAKERQSA